MRAKGKGSWLEGSFRQDWKSSESRPAGRQLWSSRSGLEVAAELHSAARGPSQGAEVCESAHGERRTGHGRADSLARGGRSLPRLPRLRYHQGRPWKRSSASLLSSARALASPIYPESPRRGRGRRGLRGNAEAVAGPQSWWDRGGKRGGSWKLDKMVGFSFRETLSQKTRGRSGEGRFLTLLSGLHMSTVNHTMYLCMHTHLHKTRKAPRSLLWKGKCVPHTPTC